MKSKRLGLMGNVPDILYHYTSVKAFSSIMKGEVIRGTHYADFGDSNEIKMGLQILRDSIPDCFSNTRPEVPSFLHSMIEALDQGERPIYVVSFSEARDSLQLWKEFCSNGGVAIGLVAEGLENHFQEASRIDKPDHRNVALWKSRSIALWKLIKCLYLEKNNRMNVQSILSKIENGLDIVKQSEGDKWKSRAAAALLSAITYNEIEPIFCSIKGKRFEWQREWRFFVTQNGETTLVVRRKRHYMRLPFHAHTVIREIWISPFGNKRRNKDRVLEALRKKNLNIKVLESQVH